MSDFVVLTNDLRELKAKLEGGHRVEYVLDGRYIISQKRGREYVTVNAESEQGAHAQWNEIHRNGYYYDWRNCRRVSIPGADR